MHWREDLRSKLADGVFGALSLYLTLVVVVLLVRPVQSIVGKPGLLIYTIFLMALSVFCLEHSLVMRVPEWYRAWYGMYAGLLAWISISLSNDLGFQQVSNLTSILVLLLLALTVTRLWRRYLPTGGRFYSLSLFLAWTGQLIISSRPILTGWYPRLQVAYHLLGYFTILGGLVVLWWIFTQTDRRLQRLYFALLLAFCIVLSVSLLAQ